MSLSLLSILLCVDSVLEILGIVIGAGFGDTLTSVEGYFFDTGVFADKDEDSEPEEREDLIFTSNLSNFSTEDRRSFWISRSFNSSLTGFVPETVFFCTTTAFFDSKRELSKAFLGLGSTDFVESKFLFFDPL